ncbi:6-bladed beta-propeller [Pedobacter sp. UYEF25]
MSILDSSKMVTLRIDPNNAKGGLVSDFFSQVEFIPLETTKESLFGQVNQLKIIENRFVFSDYDTKAVYIFDMDGKFRAKINNKMLMKEDSEIKDKDYFGFSVKNLDGKETIQMNSAKYIFYYNTDGQFIEKFRRDEIKDDYSRTYFKSPWDYLQLGRPNYKKRDSTVYEISTYKNNKQTNQYFPFTIADSENNNYFSNGSGFFDYGVDDELLYARAHDYRIYLVTPEKLFVAYQFVFPMRHTMPKDFRTAKAYGVDRFQWLLKNKDVIFGIGNTYLCGKNFFFKTAQLGGNDTRKSDLIYNLENGKLTSVSDLQPDSLSQFLPVTDAGVGNDFLNKGFFLYKDQSFYTSISSLVMFNLKEQKNDKKTKYNAALTKLFKEGSRKDNPIIVRLKPKLN